MDNTPIFDMIDRERSYTETMAETKRILARHTSPLFVRVVPVPDEEEEVFVRPFVKTEETPRGAIAGLFAKDRPEPAHEQEEPAPYDYVVGSEPGHEASRTFARVSNDLADAPGIQLTATALEAVTGPQYETVREETEFDPLDLSEKGFYFTDFAMETIAKFREEHPDVDKLEFFIDPSKSFASPKETFVVHGRRLKEQIQNPDEVIARPLPGIQLDEHLPEFGVQLIGAQDVPEDVLAAYRAAVAQQYPGCMPMAVTAIQEDGSATVTFEGKDFSPLGWVREEDLVDDTDTTEFEKRSLEYFGKKPWESDKSLSRKMRTTE